MIIYLKDYANNCPICLFSILFSVKELRLSWKLIALASSEDNESPAVKLLQVKLKYWWLMWHPYRFKNTFKTFYHQYSDEKMNQDCAQNKGPLCICLVYKPIILVFRLLKPKKKRKNFVQPLQEI